MDKNKIEKAIVDILEAIGEDPNREGLIETPKRVAKMYEEIYSGLHEDVSQNLTKVFQTESYDELILIRDIPFYSMCEHHLLPFFGVVHIAYVPKKGKLLGLSKLGRVVDCIAKRPQLQERITNELADYISKSVDPQGVMVTIEARHMCMEMRGIKKMGCVTVTNSIRGAFKEDQQLFAKVNSSIYSAKI